MAQKSDAGTATGGDSVDGESTVPNDPDRQGDPAPVPTPPQYRSVDERYSPERAAKHRERAKQSGYYGVMFAGDYKWSDADCIKHAYSDDTTIRGRPKRSLKAHTTWLTAAEAKECIGHIPKYNRFHPVAASKALDRIPGRFRVVVGRESSVVMYLWAERPAKAMRVLEGIDGTFVEGDQSGIFGASGPDELGAITASDVEGYPLMTVGYGPSQLNDGEFGLVRAWWD